MAIDELNGVGWWATDRNLLDDNLTIYLFKVNDTRVNYDPDEEEADIEQLALISDYKSTQNPDENYSELLDAVKNISVEKKKRVDFTFPMSGGRVYTTLEDFTTAGGRSAMRRYLEAEKQFKASSAELANFRRQYDDSPTSTIKDKIRTLEIENEQERENLKMVRNEVYREEGN